MTCRDDFHTIGKFRKLKYLYSRIYEIEVESSQLRIDDINLGSIMNGKAGK